MAIAERFGLQFVDLHQPPYTRFHVPEPAMFRWYDLSSELQDIDLFVSIAKMKSHHLCGVTLTMKNLFGLPPGPVYGSPRGALHSAIRLPRILADLTQLFAPGICLVDGIVGCNYAEWAGDPVASSILIAGNNAVATDAIAARFMGVDPEAYAGTSPFIRAENHIKLASSLGLGPVRDSEIDLVGVMPTERRPFTVQGAAEPEIYPEMERQRREVCKLAQWYFDDRNYFTREYLGESVCLGKDKVLFHAKTGEMQASDVFQALAAEKLGLYEMFFKLVQTEEAELRAPYSL